MIGALRIAFLVVLFGAYSLPAEAQLGLFSTEQRIAFTPDWHGERFADGRPKVADAILARLKDTDAEQAWDVLQEANYFNQFEGHWKVINPGERMVGRVVTAVFMPRRPDVDSVIQAMGKKEGRIGDENSWIIDILEPKFLAREFILQPLDSVAIVDMRDFVTQDRRKRVLRLQQID